MAMNDLNVDTQVLQEKIQLLKMKLDGYDQLAVAFSGGVDSTFLLLCAFDVLGEDVLAVTMAGPQYLPDETAYTKKLCEERGIAQLLINMPEDLFETFADNPPDRCYICKKGIFGYIKESLGDVPVADGTNADDTSDYRPGLKALKELGIISPLEEVGLTKAEIRMGLKAMNVPIWDKPSCACLASRIPYGQRLTLDKMNTIYILESFIKELGFPQVRVRHHGNIAIVEVPPEDREDFARAQVLDVVNEKIRNAGFLYATMDLGGYTTGKLNEAL